MANSDLRQFLQDILLRYDPDIDLSEGSRADSELVQPILQRIGIDPFDEDILTFIRTRIQQQFPNLAITEADELTDLLIDPMRVLIEPLVREIKLVKLRSSLRNADSLSDDEIDALMGNFFMSRLSGGFAVGVVRVYFATPQSISVTLTNPATTRSGLRFLPTRPQAITADQMLLNREGSEYYFDINYTAENRGDQYNVEPNEIVSIANLPTATRVRNPRRFRGGIPRENNLDFIARASRSLSDKTLTVDRGIVATLTENFPAIRRIFSVGFRDPEMKRDVIKGGSLGPIPAPDINGSFFGNGVVADDLDGDLTSPLLEDASGAFVARLGAAGTKPEGWFVTISYNGPDLVVGDFAVLEVISSSRIRIDHEMPTSVGTVLWMLRRRSLTISDIPGGIVLPDTASGTLEILQDEVHIGGKTDIYIAGEIELSTAQIKSLTDQSPSAKGFDAETRGTVMGEEDIVVIHDPSGIIQPGFSLVLEEGVDAGSYRILEIVSGGTPLSVRIDTDLTGSQGSLAWKVVDEIDVELTDPKDIKVDGADLVTSAGNNVVTTVSATNFIDANVQEGDILEIFDDEFGGEFRVDEVGAVQLTVTPAPARTFTTVAYRVFRRSEAVDPPVVRIRSMELLDSTGAPSGTKIPYREPLLALSNAFQNEGSGFVFEGLCVVGLVSTGVTASSGTYNVGVSGGLTIEWETYDKDAYWNDRLHGGTLTFGAGPPKTAAQVVAEINADPLLDAAGVKAVVITKLDKDYVGIVSPSLVVFTGGTALSVMGWSAGVRNSQMRSVDDQFSDAGVRQGDLISVVEGNSAGTLGRVINGPVTSGLQDVVTIGSGPVGPEDTEGAAGLYNNTVFNPDVNVLVRIGRPSVGSARIYFMDPTSADFSYQTMRATADVPEATLVYRPDPENLRVVRPPPPLTELPNTGETADTMPGTLTDTEANFLLYGVQPGDLVDILYVPITGTAPLDATIQFSGTNNTLRLRLDTDPFITVSFPFRMTRQEAVDFINKQVGEDIASLSGSGALVLKSSRRIELDPTSTVITHVDNLLKLAGARSTTDHPDKGTYIVKTVSETVLTFSTKTGKQITHGITPNTHYRIRRYTQRISSTEMNLNRDVSGMYYADVQMVSMGPGDIYNIGAGVTLKVEGVRSDGYRLVVDNPVTSFSRAEVLRAEISRTILLVGSADDPVEAVQLSQQNVQVSYDRSQLVDEVQSFCDSDFQRVVCQEILVRHLLPHYVSLVWSYVGGASEPDMRRAVDALLDKIEPDEQLEVTDLIDVLRRRGATSVFTPDSSSQTGRTAPFFIVVSHDEKRRIRAQIVKDFVTTVRTQRYIPDAITLTRITTGGIR